MKILMCAWAFAPSVGGLETVSSILADEFTRLGSAITVVTNTPGVENFDSYSVVRQPSWPRLRRLAAHADIILQCNISLRTLFPLLPLHKPTFIAHHGLLTRTNGRRGVRDHLKLAILSRFHNIAISEAIASHLPVSSVVIGNPFERGEFKDLGASHRTRDLVFMGRLVPDKGCDVLLRALGKLKTEGICPTLSVIGDGPELPGLKRLAAQLSLAEQVSFRGVLRAGRGAEVARHKIMVVPSLCKEGFGVVALEGIAAGCVVVASSSGGLPETVGPCGLLFPRGDVAALASQLKLLLANPATQQQLLNGRMRHLEQFLPDAVAKHYLEIFSSALQ
jgi:glycogen synthase